MIGKVVARLGAGGVLAAALVLAATSHAIDASGAQPRAFTVDAPPPMVACPGMQTVPVGDVGTGGELASEPTQRALAVQAPGEQIEAGLGVGVDADVASQMERIGDGDIQGWSALTCTAPATDQWLVGGSTGLGNSARLVLTNPTDAPTEATVTIYGPLGAVEETLNVPVAPHGQADRLLEGTAAELATLTVHVVATGPGVSAALQDSRLDGFQPAGTAWVGPSVAATSLVIPLVGAGLESGTSQVRLMAPEGARVDLTLISEIGVERWSVGRSLILEPGVVTDITVPTDSLSAIEVDADAPVLAGARLTVQRDASEGLEGDIAFDHAWVAGLPSGGGASVAVVPDSSAQLVVYSPYSTDVTFTDAGGATVASARIQARTVQWVPIDASPGTVVRTDAAVAWAMVMISVDGYVAAVTPIRPAQGDLQATVVPGSYPAEP